MTRPERWQRAHGRLALAVTLAAAGLGALLPTPGLPAQVFMLAALVAVLGLPHGAADPLPGAAVFRPRLGPAWPLAFGGLYVLAALAVLGLWALWPAAVLLGFLLLAVAHFGAEDRAATGPLLPGRAGAALEAGLRGALPVALPVLFHGGEVAALFAALLPEIDAGAVAGTLPTLLGAPGVAYLAALAALGLGALWRGRPGLAAELAALVAAFAVLPPLLAFALYFCFWHAPRHTLGQAAAFAPEEAPGDLAAGLRRIARTALPMTVATVALAGAVFALSPAGLDAETVGLRVIFLGLAALTVPHVALAAVAGRVDRP